MKTKLICCTIGSLAIPAAPVHAALLFMDNFDVVDTTNFDGASTAERLSGSLADSVELKSARNQQQISNNQLLMQKRPNLPNGNGDGSTRIRFHETGTETRFNFAAGATGTAIAGAGGVRVEFDWTAANTTSTDWVSLATGIGTGGEPGTRIVDGATDFGILFRNNGGIQRFDNGPADPLTLENAFTPSTTQKHVMIDFLLTSFDDGQNVTANSYVDGVQVDSYTFQWDNNAGVINMELGNIATGTLIDNLAVSTIPEPSALLLSGFGILGLLRRRRNSFRPQSL